MSFFEDLYSRSHGTEALPQPLVRPARALQIGAAMDATGPASPEPPMIEAPPSAPADPRPSPRPPAVPRPRERLGSTSTTPALEPAGAVLGDLAPPPPDARAAPLAAPRPSAAGAPAREARPGPPPLTVTPPREVIRERVHTERTREVRTERTLERVVVEAAPVRATASVESEPAATSSVELRPRVEPRAERATVIEPRQGPATMRVARTQAPRIEVSIGRVLVRAAPSAPASAPPSTPSAPSPSMSLEDYLTRRSGG